MFSDNEREKYGVVNNVFELKLPGINLKRRVDRLKFPGGEGHRGHVLGVTIESCEEGNVYWCLSPDFRVGKKELEIEVKSDDSRGMHVSTLHRY